MIDPPLDSDEPEDKLDWLELVALFASEKTVHIDSVINALEIAEDQEAENIADADVGIETIQNDIAEEVQQRTNALGEESYPYQISSNGETLKLRQGLTYGHKTYLACLVLNHSWATGKLVPPWKLNGPEIRAGRAHFEVFSAVAALGLSGGPSFLLGTNRANAEGLLARIAQVCERVGEGSARPAVHEDAPDAANDDKVDVLAVEMENDAPPHRSFWFCQSAAGADFVNKPIVNEVDRFLELWFFDRPTNTSAAVFCPALLTQTQVNYHTRRLGQIFHRLRMPLHAQRGFALYEQNADLLNYVDDANAPCTWLDQYVERVEQVEGP